MTAIEPRLNARGETRDTTACRHCGLPVPAGAESAFCCSGCATVFELIQSSDLDRFYELGGGRGQPVGPLGGGTANLEWLEACITPVDADVSRLEVDVQGIHCAACVWLLQEVFRRQSGGLDFDLNPTLGRMRILYGASFEVSTFLDACESFGYRVGPPGKVEANEERELLVRLGVTVVFALNAMLFSFAEYTGMSAADGDAYVLFRWLSATLATLAVAVGGPVFFRAAWAGVRRRVLHLDLPIALGIGLGYGASLFAFVTGLGAAYFDSVTVFVALMLAGRFVQQRAIRQNRNYLLENDGAEHVRVRRLRAADGSVERVTADEIGVGDELLLVPGDLVPVRAQLRDAAASLSLDWINGESEPRRFEAGDEVPAGAFVAGRRGVRVAVLATAADSGLHALLAVPNDPEEQDRSRFWDRLNRVYVAAVLGLALLAAVAWAVIDPSRIVDVVTAVLIVTCPCALGIAIPLAFDLAVARLRRQGVFVRRSSLLDTARGVRRIVFDKTGTLTWGGLRATSLRDAEGEARDVLYSMAQSSNHPVSRAIANTLEGARFLAELEVEDVPGSGSRVVHGGHEYRLGSSAFTLGDAQRNGESVCVFTRDGHVESCFSIEEDLRAGAADELHTLEADGLDVWIASGDRAAKVSLAAERLGLDKDRAVGDMSPTAKAELVERLGAADTMMIGDGLNDAPAFDAAACAGTPALDRPLMPSRSDFFYVGAGVGAVTAVLGGARRFGRVVRANLWLAAIYNAGALALCFAGVMTPLLVAVLMPLSSLALIANTMRGIGARRAMDLPR